MSFPDFDSSVVPDIDDIVHNGDLRMPFVHVSLQRGDLTGEEFLTVLSEYRRARVHLVTDLLNRGSARSDVSILKSPKKGFHCRLVLFSSPFGLVDSC
ncbi:MAG: hypothetical protein KC994_11870 [Candidatus Omnitrophica bacterium]|nr:hypothetical protein [Candidatus Omnitrophota bacterium]